MEKWTDFEEHCAPHIDRWVTVYQKTGELILRGKLVPYTDLVNGAAILEPHSKRGFDYVIGAIPLPYDSEKLEEATANFLFEGDQHEVVSLGINVNEMQEAA